MTSVISTRNLAGMPSPPELMRIMQSLAMLDAIVEEEWAYRYFSFNAKWSSASQMGSMRNGSGDDLFAHFDAAGCFLRGFDHESFMSPWRREERIVWPGVLDAVPGEFADGRNEPAFHMEDTTFCIWHGPESEGWQRGPIAFPDGSDPDGSAWMLSFYDGNPETYRAFAEEYFEVDLATDAIARVFAHEPLSPALLSALGSARDWAEITADAQEIGYPIRG